MIGEDDLMLLSAYVDGELDGADLTRLKERLLKEPELRRELDAIRAADDLMKSYAGQMDSKPVPEKIQTLVGVRSGRSAIRLFAVAAAVFLVTVGSFLMAPPSTLDYTVIEDLESGQRLDLGDDYLEVITSFRQHDGRYCRELMTSRTHEVVCRLGSRWHKEVEVPRLDPPPDSFQPAGGGDLGAIDTYIREHMAGSIIETEAERQLIENNWQ